MWHAYPSRVPATALVANHGDFFNTHTSKPISCVVWIRDNDVTLPVYTVRAGTISKTGSLRAAAIKSARGVGWDGKVRRRTNPRSGDARRGANTSLSTLPAVSGGNSTTVMGRWLRPRLSTPSPAVRRLRTQLELSWRWVETRKLRPLRSAIAKQERVRLPERTRAGLERVRREGKRLGRPVAKVDSAAIRRMREQGESWSEIARRTGLSRGTVQKVGVRAAATATAG